MFLYLILLLLLFEVSAFGVTYLLLRKTPYAPYSMLLALIFFQPFLLVLVTLLGYRMPHPLRHWSVLLTVLAGTVLTVFICVRFRVEILASLRQGWKASLLIAGLAIASMLLATPVLIGSTSLAYIDWWNGELVNYSILAQYFLGALHDSNHVDFSEQNVALRYGAELFLASLSVFTGKAPLLLVEVLSALHKFSAIVAFAVSFELIRSERRILPVAVAIADIGFAFAAILSLNHVFAFLAAQAVTGCFILLSLGLFSQGIRMRGVQIFFAIQVLFIAITYSEALPFLCAAAALVFGEALLTRRKDLAQAILCTFGAGLLVNPALLDSRLRWLFRLISNESGFNLLGSPKDDLASYLAAALGFRYQYIDVPPLPTAVVTIALLFAIPAIVCAFAVASIRLRTLLFLAIPLVVMLVHLNLIPGVQPPGSYYKSYKTIAALYFYTFVALGILFDSLLRRTRQHWPYPIIPTGLALGILALVGCNVFVSVRASSAIKAVPSVYRETDFQHVFAPATRSQGPLTVLADDNTAAIWDVMANYMQARLRLTDNRQAQIVSHHPSPILSEPPIFSATLGKPVGVQAVRAFAGRIIIPRIAAYPPFQFPTGLNLRTALEGISPGARLLEGKTLIVAQAFRMVEGALIQTGDPQTAADGKPNRSPVIAGIMPDSGQGSSVTLNLQYSDPNGSSDIQGALIHIRSEKSTSPNECSMSLAMSSSQLGLVLDGGKDWGTSILQSPKNLENENCEIDVAHSSTSAMGDDITLHLAIKFKSAFAGRKIIESAVFDEGKLTTGWKHLGSWTVP